MGERQEMNTAKRTEERMRFRDLVLQIERFLKYAPRGTDSDVLRREAAEFHRRLGAFEGIAEASTVERLQRKLTKLSGS